jgi:hypothetical protein
MRFFWLTEKCRALYRSARPVTALLFAQARLRTRQQSAESVFYLDKTND